MLPAAMLKSKPARFPRQVHGCCAVLRKLADEHQRLEAEMLV